MPDGRQNFETKEVVTFTGLHASVNPTKDEFLDSDSPSQKNFVSFRGILEARQGRARVNATRYANEITSIVSYQDRSNVRHSVFSVKTVATDPTTPDGTVQQEVL